MPGHELAVDKAAEVSLIIEDAHPVAGDWDESHDQPISRQDDQDCDGSPPGTNVEVKQRRKKIAEGNSL
jgi:hypothetical protein